MCPTTTGRFNLLYWPFDFPATGDDGPVVTPDEPTLRRQIARDVVLLAHALETLFTRFGFGAKTSSGHGTAFDLLAEPGQLLLKARLPGLVVAEQVEAPTSPPANYLETAELLAEDFRQPDDSLKSEAQYQQLIESRGQQYTGSRQKLYDKARRWWAREGRQFWENRSAQPEEAAADAPEVATVTFERLSELPAAARRLATALEHTQASGGAK